MSLSIKRIDKEIDKRSLLEHPFYRMWSDGKLAINQLAGYSKEYYQLVKAVPKLVSNIASFAKDASEKDRIHESLEEELTHIEPWIMFANLLGVTRNELENHEGARRTLDCVEGLNRLTRSSFLEGVAAMYAYERQLPEISRSKIEGLKMHYGLDGKDATRYFELHEEADIRHAALWREILLLKSEGFESSIIHATIDSLSAQNSLLDSVVANYC